VYLKSLFFLGDL